MLRSPDTIVVLKLKCSDTQKMCIRDRDVEGLKTQLSTLQTKYDTDIAAVRKASAIDIALANSKAKNGKAARALLDLDAVKLDGNKLLGFDDQLEALKKSDPWLFEADTTKQDDGTGVHVDTGAEHGQGGSAEPSDGVTAVSYTHLKETELVS